MTKSRYIQLNETNCHQQSDQIRCQKTLAIKDAQKDESVTGKVEPSVIQVESECIPSFYHQMPLSVVMPVS